MDELKKALVALDGKTAFIINALFAVLFIVFFLALPVFNEIVTMSGAQVLSHSATGGILICLLILMLALAAVIYPFLKKMLSPSVVYLMTYTFVIMLLSAGATLGIGSILNIVIVLAPWCLFCWCRKGLPAEV